MADDDNFDIDIYGEDGPPEGNEKQENTSGFVDSQTQDEITGDGMIPHHEDHNEEQEVATQTSIEPQETDQGQQSPFRPPNANANTQAPLDSDATSCLIITEMQWWTNDDDIRGWTNKCGHEDDLKDITFAEYKINGKSRGSAYVEMTSAEAASAVKHHLSPDNQKGENKTSSQPFNKPVTVSYAQPNSNPFLATAKDGPNRQNNTTPTSSYNNNNNNSNVGNQSFRGGGHQSNFRGRGMGSRGNHNFRGGGGGMGFQSGGGAGQMNGGFNNGQMGGGFGGPMNNMGGGFGGGFGNRGGGNMGMMGGNMRGNAGPGRGRAGGGGNMNMMGANMPMGMGAMQMQGGMPMGPMGNMGNMGNMGMGMMGNFNPNFFQGNHQQGMMRGNSGSSGGGDNWNPHGAKRMRPD